MLLTRCAILLCPVAAAACAAPIRAEHVGPDAAYAEVQSSVLTARSPSATARLVLERADLVSAWDADPAAAIAALHDLAAHADTRERLYGLAELSLTHALNEGDPRWALGAAVYAYLFLFGQADAPPPGPFDPRLRLACDIYARGVAEAFRDPESGEFRPRGGRLPLPVGEIDVSVPSAEVRVGDVVLDAFASADDYAVQGMRARVRTEGLGLPLVARRRNVTDDEATRIEIGRVPRRLQMAATALLSVEGELADLGPGGARAVLEIHSPHEMRDATVRGQRVPLAVDLTTPIAATLTASRIWSFETSGFLSRDESEFENGVILMSPYRRGKVPVVLVHGTVSSPARWVELVNELTADPVIAQSCQLWLFMYGSGVPIVVSAASLRNSLRETLQVLDPEGTDPALRRMVLIGHSQGGLLARLMVTSSGDRFWRNVSDEPFESMDLSDEQRATLRDALFFEPVPAVERVVYLSTPHRGSFVAGNVFGEIGSWLVTLPRKLVDETTDALRRNVARLRGDQLGALPTSVDNMQPGSPFLLALNDRPMDPRVHVHSVVAVDGDGPVEEGDDGVVTYQSAHLPDAESEIVVRCNHSTQGHPRTILEIRRILREHLAQAP